MTWICYLKISSIPSACRMQSNLLHMACWSRALRPGWGCPGVCPLHKGGETASTRSTVCLPRTQMWYPAGQCHNWARTRSLWLQSSGHHSLHHTPLPPHPESGISFSKELCGLLIIPGKGGENKLEVMKSAQACICVFYVSCFVFLNWWVWERERNIGLLFHSLMHTLVDSCMCSGWGSNSQPRRIRTTLWPPELPGQGCFLTSSHFFMSVNGAEYVCVCMRVCMCIHVHVSAHKGIH